MKTLTKQQLFTCAALFLLLVSRLRVVDIVSNFLQLFHAPALPASLMSGIGLAQDWTYTLFYHWSFILVGLVIIVTRSDLQSLNIDGGFVAIFSVACLTYWTYYRWPSGWIALLLPVGMYILYKRKELKFVKLETSAGLTTQIVLIGFFLGLLLEYNSLTSQKILSVTHLIVTTVPLTLVEEVLFRGLLWKFLVNLNWSVIQIVILQAFMFWLSHTIHMFTLPFVFWACIPIVAVLLGVIVWRSKSLTVSFLAHMLSNFLLVVYQM